MTKNKKGTLQYVYCPVILRNKVTKDLSSEGFCKLSEKDPSLTLRMADVLQRALYNFRN